MSKVEITEWGELAITEKLLTDYTQHTSAIRDSRVSHARTLLKRVRQALIESTEKNRT